MAERLINVEYNISEGFFIATSPDVPGLVVEEETYPAMIDSIRALVPALLRSDVENNLPYPLSVNLMHHLSLESIVAA